MWHAMGMAWRWRWGFGFLHRAPRRQASKQTSLARSLHSSLFSLSSPSWVPFWFKGLHKGGTEGGRAAPPGRAVGPGPFKFPRPFAIWQPGNFNLLSTCPSFRNLPFRRPRQELNLLLTAKPRTGRVYLLTALGCFSFLFLFYLPPVRMAHTPF